MSLMPKTADDPRWARILARDPACDGRFWYSVQTTGVYCRPSCASRAARPENVAIHDTLTAARATGARACLRCRPDEADPGAARAALVARACRLIEDAEERPTLTVLAAGAGLSPFHFQRVFKAATGLTPRGYAEAHRAARLRAALSDGTSVTGALHEAGYESGGCFYGGSRQRLGMTPSRYRAGGPAEQLRFAVGPCALGTVLVASSAAGVAAILLGDDPDALLRDLQDRFPRAALVGGDAAFEAVVAQVVAFMARPTGALDLPLDIRGTVFQQRVWTALQAIPPGRTASYAEIARAVGVPGAVRAVAGACAANAHAVAIPCHRVIRQDGALSGYRWGIARKRALLDGEQDGADADAPAPGAVL